MSPVQTFGLTHIALAVPDVDTAFAFYEAVLGVIAIYRDDNFIQAQTPGSRDVLVFEKSDCDVGITGGIAHFGFRLTDPASIDEAARLVIHAGGVIESRGEFVPGEPYVFARDPNGYLFELWYEIPTRVDPS